MGLDRNAVWRAEPRAARALLSSCGEVRCNGLPDQLGRRALVELQRLGEVRMPGLRARDPHLADRRKDGRVIEAGRMHELDKRCFGAGNRHRRTAIRAKQPLHRAATVGLDLVGLQGFAMELKSVRRKDQAGRKGAAAGSLTIAAVADQLHQRTLAAGVSHRAAGATATDFSCHRSPLVCSGAFC